MAEAEAEEIQKIFRERYPAKYKTDSHLSRPLILAHKSIYYDVQNVDSEVLIDKIQMIVRNQKGEYRIPNRHNANQQYVPIYKRILLKKGQRDVARSINNEITAQAMACTTRVLKVIYNLIIQDTSINIRKLFSDNQDVFDNQAQSVEILEDIALMLDCSRNSLKVYADSGDGRVAGILSFTLKAKDTRPKLKLVVNGWNENDQCSQTLVNEENKSISCLTKWEEIPVDIDSIEEMYSTALFVLIVGSHAMFDSLFKAGFHRKFQCIMITGAGYPDVHTRQFLQRIKRQFEIPVLALTNCDVRGIRIMSVYRYGSKNLSFMNLATPDIKWLGVRPSDVNMLDILPTKMGSKEYKDGMNLCNEDFMKDNEDWAKELTFMMETKQTIKMDEVLKSNGNFITAYLERKIKQLDLL